jgi:hypothetical protein
MTDAVKEVIESHGLVPRLRFVEQQLAPHVDVRRAYQQSTDRP